MLPGAVLGIGLQQTSPAPCSRPCTVGCPDGVADPVERDGDRPGRSTRATYPPLDVVPRKVLLSG